MQCELLNTHTRTHTSWKSSKRNCATHFPLGEMKNLHFFFGRGTVGELRKVVANVG